MIKNTSSPLLESSSRRVLVIGGGGYVGSAITPQFLDAGYTVRCLDSFIYNHELAVAGLLGQPGFEMVRGDFCDSAVVMAALEGADDVVLLGGLVGDPITKTYPEASQRINTIGYQTIFNCLDQVTIDRVVFISTCSNYGLIPEDKIADEAWPLSPLSLYAEAKVLIERHLLESTATLNYTPTILRFATAFGLSPRMRFDLTISQFTRELEIGQKLVVFDADTWRPYCHVQDFARLLLTVLAAPKTEVRGEVFNAGGDANNFTKRMLIDLILSHVRQDNVTYQQNGSDPRNYRVSFKKVRDILNFEPTYHVNDGIIELLDAMNNGFFRDVSIEDSFYGNWKIEEI